MPELPDKTPTREVLFVPIGCADTYIFRLDRVETEYAHAAVTSSDGDDTMCRRTVQAGIAGAGFLLLTGLVSAQQAADVDAVKAANTAFYAALSARDVKAMKSLWTNNPTWSISALSVRPSPSAPRTLSPNIFQKQRVFGREG